MKRSLHPPNNHDPDVVIAKHRASLHHAEERGERPPPSLLNALGDAYMDKGDLTSAVDSFRSAAEAYALEGLHSNAVACCRKIQRYTPEDGRVGIMVGRYLAAAGLRADAIDELTSHAGQRVRRSDRRGGIEALEEVLRIDPDQLAVRERLAGLYRDEGDPEAATSAYRDLLKAYAEREDEEGEERVRVALAEVGSTAAETLDPETEIPEQRESESEARVGEAGGVESVEHQAEAVPSEVVIDPTSYDEVTPERDLETPITSPEPGHGDPVEDVAEDVTSRVDAPSYPGEVRALEEKVRMDPAAHEEMATLATRYEEMGKRAEAVRLLLEAAGGLQSRGLWQESVDVHRRLYGLDALTGETFAGWTESARQTGEAWCVLEALEAASRWHIAHSDPLDARRAAEEMLLIDPDSDSAAEILASLGSALPGE
jgi:tetratricopeptide (TPR) repeat protein